MRVIHVDPERGWGGGEVQVLGLVERQARAGLDIVLALDPSGRLAPRATDRGITTAPLRIRNHIDVLAGLRLRRLARGADVVHFHTARAHALAPWVLGLGARRVVTRRMDYVPRGGWVTRLLYERCVDVVIAISEGVRRALVAAGIDEASITVVPSGVDLDRIANAASRRAPERRALGIDDDETLVVGLGTLVPRKGFDVLIAAASQCEHPVRVVLAGDGPERDALRRQAEEAGVSLALTGFRDDVAPLLGAADIVAVPSRAEGLGIAALEAMAAGRAVVSSCVGGLAEVVTDGETGICVPPDDPAALARAVDRLARDPVERARIGQNAARRVRELFSLDAMAAGTFDCYVGTA